MASIRPARSKITRYWCRRLQFRANRVQEISAKEILTVNACHTQPPQNNLPEFVASGTPHMNAAKRRFVLSGLKLFDISLLILSFGLATVFVAYGDKGVGLEQFFSMRVKLSNCIAFVSIVLAWHIIFSFCGLYESRRLSARHAELVDVIKATSLSSVLLAVLAASHRITMITPSFLASFWLVSSFLLTASRLVLRPLLASLRRRGRNLRYVLVLGTNSRAIDFARKIEAIPELGYRILGFVDDDWHGMPEFRQTGFPLVSAYKDLPEFLRRNVVDEVAMYLPFGAFYEASCQAAALCEQHGITLRFDGDIFGLKKSRSTPMMNLTGIITSPPLRGLTTGGLWR